MFIPNPTARLGENIATEYLKKKRYKVIERNFRKGYGEIDIIAIKDNVLVFIEVKTRTTSLFGGAAEAIDYRKVKSLIKTSQFYVLTHKNLPETLRIDAILIDLNSNKDILGIEHVENISGL